MLHLIKSSLEANKRLNLIMILIFIIISFYKFEAGLVAALYIIIKIGKSISDYNYFNEIKNMVKTFPSSKDLYPKYCIINNNITSLIILVMWVIIGMYKKEYSTQQLIFYSLIIYTISTFYKFMFDISEINNRKVYVENIRKMLFVILAILFIIVSRTPNLYEHVGNIVFSYSNTKMLLIIVLSIILNILYYKILKYNANKF
ncbi:hypothetical protein [Peptoniphilus phoceensis]|uniref:hypothetical protein n=1 Tax=Peptoniphilus phoceensis TaxID=1720298 RepID=UPI000784CF26|nr:hypothetical protein [Peptoniphilus phoceensis]